MLNPDFRDMLSALCNENAEFLLVGAYALAAHGLPRATGDLDIWIRCSDENAHRVEIENLTVAVIGRSHLIQNKKTVGRPQDIADVAWLERDEH